MMTGSRRAGARVHKLAMAASLQQSALVAAMRPQSDFSGLVGPGCGVPGDPRSPSRLFRGTPDQVREVRKFVRDRFAGHAAVEAAVLAASELATNAIKHSASGSGGGVFLVHLTELSAGHVAVLVTDQGGFRVPHAAVPGPCAESGRGLAVVKALASLLEFFDDGELTSVLAIVCADGHDRGGSHGDGVAAGAGGGGR